ncbi:MAG: hypothetical protein ACO20W_08925, partial [Anaerohalosphaeraceae bacterium]
DYIPQAPEQITATVLDQLTGGAVILLHERSLHTNNGLKGNLSAVKMMVQEIKKRKYSFARISDVIPEKNR